MAIGSGLASQVGAAKETTYGTRVVPAKFFEFESESLALDKNYINSRGLRAGRTFQRSSRRVATVRTAGGAVRMEVPTQGFGFWLDLLHGNAVTPVQQGATAAYKQTHDLGTTDPSKSATIQVGRPDSGGTVRPFDYLGCMVTGWQLACEVGGFLTAQFTLDGRDEKTDQSLAVASYPSGLRSFNFTQGEVRIGGSVVAVVNSFTLSGGIARKVDRHFFGSSGLKSKPIQNDYSTAEAGLNCEFAGMTEYNHFVNGDIAEVILDFQGETIEGANKEQLKVTLSAAGFNGETPNVDGPDMLSLDVPVVALDNGTAPPVRIEYVSTDTTL